MAKFTANMKFVDLETNTSHEADVPFEMTVKRSKELMENIARDFPEVDFKLKRIDTEGE